ncbi:MAG TPA: DNA repair protein RecO [Longimicrobiales bacterium]|nr:DNA repair protein RecO [Longimicrobiales bacterium]
MPLVTTEATILQAFPYSETSKILRLLTPGHGVQSVIAKGARRPRSRYGGILEPFTDGVASFYHRPHRDLHNLSGFELVRPRQPLGRDLIRFGAASLLAEIVLRTVSEQAVPEVFAQLRDSLNALEQAPAGAVEPVALARAWSLVAALGFGPALDRCAACGGDVEAAADLFFDYTAGGILCGGCGAVAGAGRVLPAAAREDVLRFLCGEAGGVQRTAAHWQLLGRFLAYHLVDADSLRSLDFLAAAVGSA